MSGNGRRLGNIEHSLDPLEIMLLWLAEARKYPSMVELAQSWKGKPEGSQPLFRLSEQAKGLSSVD